MQSDNTSNKTRKTAKEKTLAVVETPKADVVKKARSTKSSPTKSSAIKKSDASPKHHHSATNEKVTNAPAKTIPVVEIAAKDAEYGYEDIARLAHSFWVKRNYSHGSPEEDWLRAERELKMAR